MAVTTTHTAPSRLRLLSTAAWELAPLRDGSVRPRSRVEAFPYAIGNPRRPISYPDAVLVTGTHHSVKLAGGCAV